MQKLKSKKVVISVAEESIQEGNKKLQKQLKQSISHAMRFKKHNR